MDKYDFSSGYLNVESVIDGLIASTGKLIITSGLDKPALWFSSYDEDFISAIGNLLQVKNNVGVYEAPGCAPLYILQTVPSALFRSAYERWYGQFGVKSLPKDGIDWLSVFFWHLSSGSVMSDGVYLTTDGYTDYGYKSAAYWLSQLGVEFIATGYGFFRIADVQSFIKECSVAACSQLPSHKRRDDTQGSFLVGVSGKARHGKDTYCELLRGLSDRPVVRLAMADPLKYETASLIADQAVAFAESPHNWIAKFREVRADMDDPASKEQYRGLNVWWGTEFRRVMYSQVYWVRRFEHQARQLMGSGRVVVCPDVRFPNEVELIKSMGGKVVRVRRSGLPDTSTHPSEVSLDDYKDWDDLIENDGSIDEYRHAVERSWTKLAGVVV